MYNQTYAHRDDPNLCLGLGRPRMAGDRILLAS